MFKYFIFILTLFFINILNAGDSLLTLKQQLDRLQREINDLSKVVYTGSKDKQAKTKLQLDEYSNLSAFDLRIYDLEKDLQQLNENFEELIFQIDDLKNLYEELSLNVNTQLLNSQNNIIDQNEIKIENDVNAKEDVEEDIIVNENSLGSIVINSEDFSDQKKEVENESENFKQVVTKLSPDDEFQRAFDMLRSQQFSEAKDALKKFIDNHSEDKLSGSAHYWLGEIYLLKKEYREAALVLAEGYQKFPQSIKSPDMLYKLSESLINIDKKKDGCNTLKKLIEEFPQHKLLFKAENKIVSLECNISIE